MAIQTDMKDHICDTVRRIGLNLGSNLGLEVPILLKELDQGSLCILNVDRCIGPAWRIVRNLQKLGIGESPNRSGKFENSKVNGRLEHQQDANSIRLRTDLQLYFLHLSAALQRRDSLINLGLCKRLSFALYEKG